MEAPFVGAPSGANLRIKAVPNGMDYLLRKKGYADALTVVSSSSSEANLGSGRRVPRITLRLVPAKLATAAEGRLSRQDPKQPAYTTYPVRLTPYPTRYLANTPGNIRQLAEAAGLAVERVDWVGGRPEYLRVTGPSYLTGWPYERLVNTVPAFSRRSGFSSLRYCAGHKPAPTRLRSSGHM